MKFLRIFLVLSILTLSAFAQGNSNGSNGCLDPDSLVLVTVTGYAIVDTSYQCAKYFLDEDGDGVAEYRLNFGPVWYEPDSSLAIRPAVSDSIWVFGALVNQTEFCSIDSLPMVVVFEINDEFWRDPFEPLWTNMGHHHQHSHGYAFGWRNDSLISVQVSGLVILDTAFVNTHYFLDEDEDDLPDYVLNFGPPWYEPVDSTLSRPVEGDFISITGGLINRTNLPMIIVYEINGEIWRDSTLMANNLGGKWIYRYMNQNRHVHAPFDTSDGFVVSPGWHGGQGPGMHDSLFCQMLQLYPENVPNSQNQNAFSGYEIGVFNHIGQNLMWMNQNIGGTLNFANQVRYKLHYNDIQLNGNNIDESTVSVKTWDNQTSNWITITDAVLDQESNTVTFASSTVSSLIILTGNQKVTSVGSDNAIMPGVFYLSQNYPNPFNPVTSINFRIALDGHVTLTIYNVLGQKLFNVIDAGMKAGEHIIQIDANALATGTYFYELKSGENSFVRKMTIIK